MTKPKNDLGPLLQEAADDGVLTPQTSTMLSGHLGEVVIAGAAGTALEDIEATDVTLVTMLIDASSSISWNNLEQAVRDGQNELIDAFTNSRESDAILMALWTFGSKTDVLHSYVPVTDAIRLEVNNYCGKGYTKLYDTWCDALTANVAYAQQLRDGGTPVRSIVVVITDGEDTRSRRKARDCKKISEELLRSEQFVLAFVGVGDETDFRRVAEKMGVPPTCVEVQDRATPSALRRVFQMVSQSVIRTSRGQIQPGAAAGFFA